jgi:alpha-amylase
MSSFDFEGSDQGPPADDSGATAPVDCDAGWVCEHRVRTTANMVAFHNQVHGTELTDWWESGADQIAFGRGAAGFVVFNRNAAELSRTFQTSLAPGTYCDIASGDFDGSTCSGPTIEVDASGQLTATVAPDSMLAVHTGAVLTE